MGEESEERQREIERTREALGEKVDALANQVRGGVDRARKKGMAVGGIVLAAAVGLITLRRRRRK